MKKDCNTNCLNFLRKNKELILKLEEDDFCTYIRRYLKHFWPMLINNINKEDMIKIRELSFRLYEGEDEENLIKEWESLKLSWINLNKFKVIEVLEHGVRRDRKSIV